MTWDAVGCLGRGEVEKSGDRFIARDLVIGKAKLTTDYTDDTDQE